MADKLDDITVSEEEREIEAETPSVDVPEVAGGEPLKTAKRSATPSTARAKQRAAAPGFFARTGQYIRDTRAEMRRVSWPTVNGVKNTTIITLIAVIFFAVYLFGIDRVWAFLIDHLRGWLGG